MTKDYGAAANLIGGDAKRTFGRYNAVSVGVHIERQQMHIRKIFMKKRMASFVYHLNMSWLVAISLESRNKVSRRPKALNCLQQSANGRDDVVQLINVTDVKQFGIYW